jgi:hypothetical protein
MMSVFAEERVRLCLDIKIFDPLFCPAMPSPKRNKTLVSPLFDGQSARQSVHKLHDQEVVLPVRDEMRIG